jgi:peptidyl-prolyl cis-trans isomerase A (cyclophilin A)
MKTAKWCAVIVAMVLLAGCKKEQPASEPPPAPVAKTETPPPPPASTETKPAPSEAMTGPVIKSSAPALSAGNLLKPATLQAKAPDTYRVKFLTTRGEFTVAVTRSLSPLGADRFYNLVRGGFYNDSSFFRVVPGFVVQFGIAAKPAVSAAWKQTEIKDDPVLGSNKRGYLTFATSGPGTRTTQIFINLKDNPRLDGMGFSPFGLVEDAGMNVIDMLYDQYGDNAGPEQDKIESQGNPYLKKGWPKLDYIISATIIGSPDATSGKKVQ